MKPIRIPTPLERAQQAVLHARAVASELRAAYIGAQHEVELAEAALHKAQDSADKAGPLATVKPEGRKAYQVVLVRKTAKTAWTRSIGAPSGRVQAWRKDAAGVWRVFGDTFFGPAVLLIDDENA